MSSADCRSSVAPEIAGALLTIDLSALRANYGWLAAEATPARCAAVVKADAYGLGAKEVSQTLHDAGCRDFFVAHLNEALALRPNLPGESALYVLNGLQPGGERPCAESGVIPVLNGLDQVEAWAALGQAMTRPLPAVLQIDTGMSRLGLAPDEIDALLARPSLLQAIDLRFAMSHLACADEPAHPANADQRTALRATLARLPALPVSFANSGGILLGDDFRFELARPGVALYGVSPTPGRGAGLRATARLDAKVVQVREVPAGTRVGYGASFIAAHPTRIATIAVGYADGWPRHLSNRGAAFFEGVRLPIAGRVSMDSITLDVTALPPGTLRLGSLVELIGPHQTLDDVAADAGTIAYEILTGLGRRYARRYIGGAATFENGRNA